MSSKSTLILKSSPVKVGLTIGDPSGIGPEITARAVAMLGDWVQFVIIGDRWVFDKSQINPNPKKFKFIDLNNVPHKNFKFGKIKAEYGKASIQYLDRALELLEDRRVDCLVTGPVSKEAVNLAGFKFSGQTEYLAEACGAKDFAMMLVNRYLKFSLITRHIPLKEVSSGIDKEKISKTILLTYRALKEWFAIKQPRLVVCGLNPHASDNGLLGSEENAVIKPALAGLRKKIKYIDGPISSDIAIVKASRAFYDCVIAMYHDQALIALKLQAQGSGVNITAGLPFVRTSPLHGTAFDIAGKNKADPNSLIEAIKLAVQCTSNLKKA